MSQSKIEKTSRSEIPPLTEPVLQRKDFETILAVRPAAVLLRDTLKILGRVDDSANLSDILFVAQECGVIEGDLQRGEIYNFSPFGPEPYRPVSGEFEYDLVFLEHYQVISRSKREEIFWPLGEEELSEEELDLRPMGAIKKPSLLKKIAQIAPERLRSMAQLLVVRRNAEDDKEFFERAKKCLFLSEDKMLKLMIELAAIVNQVRQEGEVNVKRNG